MQTRKLYAYTHFGVVTIFIQLLQVAISDVEQDMVPAGADASELESFDTLADVLSAKVKWSLIT